MTNQTTNNQSVITCLSNVLDWFKVKREAEGFKFDESLLKEVQSDLTSAAARLRTSPVRRRFSQSSNVATLTLPH